MTEKFDLLVFVYDGSVVEGDPTELAFIIRNTDENDAVSQMSDMEMYNSYMINGCVQLSREQTHFHDTAILQPARFRVGLSGGWVWLHEVPEWSRVKAEEAYVTQVEDVPE